MAKKKDTPSRDARDPHREHPTWSDRERAFEARPVRHGAEWSAIIVGGLIGLALLSVVAIWLFNVATADPKGQGDAYRDKQSSVNRIQQQARFEDLYASYKTYPARLAVAKEALTESGTDLDKQMRHTEYQGLRQGCLQVVQDYNSAARQYLARDFRAVDLPASLTTSGCKAA